MKERQAVEPLLDAALALPPADRPNLVCSDRVAGPLSWGVAPGAIIANQYTML